jgi:hypothetical protein
VTRHLTAPLNPRIKEDFEYLGCKKEDKMEQLYYTITIPEGTLKRAPVGVVGTHPLITPREEKVQTEIAPPRFVIHALES